MDFFIMIVLEAEGHSVYAAITAISFYIPNY